MANCNVQADNCSTRDAYDSAEMIIVKPLGQSGSCSARRGILTSVELCTLLRSVLRCFNGALAQYKQLRHVPVQC